jgi:hydroxypyruvate isomerase
MPRFAANLTMMFTEWDFLDRFAAAADAGFDAVEILFPYEHEPDAVAARLAANGLTLALFNLPPGDFTRGERGFAALPERRAELRAGTVKALTYARATGVGRLHMMAGIAPWESPAAAASYREAVAETAATVGAAGLDLVIEPINPRDVPGYFLNDFGRAERLIRELALPNLQLQFDIYHCQIIHGDVATRLRALMPLIGHVQIANPPDRSEPDGSGELNYPYLFAELDRLGYSGFVGCEYRPRGGTTEGLGWLSRARG